MEQKEDVLIKKIEIIYNNCAVCIFKGIFLVGKYSICIKILTSYSLGNMLIT